MVISGRSNGSLVGSTWVANSVVSLLMISVVAKISRLCRAGINFPVSGIHVIKLPPTLIRARNVSRFDLVGQHGARPLVDEGLRLRAAARTGAERPLDRRDRQQVAESL